MPDRDPASFHRDRAPGVLALILVLAAIGALGILLLAILVWVFCAVDADAAAQALQTAGARITGFDWFAWTIFAATFAAYLALVTRGFRPKHDRFGRG